VLYGDSSIFGWGVNAGERFSDLLEAATPGLEIWNHAVPGWGLDQEIVLYEKEGEALPADEVIFFVDGSTLSRIHFAYLYSKYKPLFVRQPDGRLAEVAPPKGRNAQVNFLYEALSPFYLPYFVQTQLTTINEFLQVRMAHMDAVPTLEFRRLIDGFSKDLLRIALDTARSRHHRMTILMANLSQADRKELRDFCQETGIPYLEIGPEITATSTSDEKSGLIFGKYDKHWNAKANKLIAEQITLQWKPGLP
jgi:hypothetical protein